MALQTRTGYTENTAKNYLIDVATVHKNVTFNDVSGEFSGTLVGATQGGVTLKIEQTYRYPEVDGTGHLQGKIKGNAILESASANAVVPIKEITAENLKMSLNGAMVDAGATEAPAGYKKITTKRFVEASDHLTNLAFVGVIKGTTNPIIAILDNPLCTGGVEIGTAENGEAVIELTFEAHATATQLLADEFPWRILFPAVA